MNDELKVVAWECIAKPDGWNGLPPKEHVAAMVDDVRADNPYWEPHRALVYKDAAERLLAERDARIAELERSLDEASKMLSAISPRAVELAKRVDELERERDEAMRDAQRYRWLRDGFSVFSADINAQHTWAYRRNGSLRGPTLDDAIDAAMKGGER